METIINIILCIMLMAGVVSLILSISNKKEIERLNISKEKEIKSIYNILHDFKRDILIVRDDVSKLKMAYEENNLNIYDAIEVLKSIRACVYLSEQEKAALNIAIDELLMLYGLKGESGESKDDK